MHVATMPTATPPERTTNPVLLASGMTLGRHRPSYTATAVTHERAIGTTSRQRRWVAAATGQEAERDEPEHAVEEQRRAHPQGDVVGHAPLRGTKSTEAKTQRRAAMPKAAR